jgi:hypothetical protein
MLPLLWQAGLAKLSLMVNDLVLQSIPSRLKRLSLV